MTNDKSYHEYMLQNSIKIDLEQNNFDFGGLFNDDLNKRVFLSSEQHAVDKNKQVELDLLKYFVLNANVKYLMIEHGHSASVMINEYLKTGDESLLLAYMEELQRTLSYTQQFYEYWKKVCQFNRTLPNDKKFQVIGIDLEWSQTARRYLQQILPEELKSRYVHVEGFLNGSSLGRTKEEKHKLYETMLKEVQLDSNDNSSSRFELEHIIQNLVWSADAYGEESNLDIYKKRELYMYQNFVSMYKQLPEGNYFGQWGLNHVFQREQLGVTWLASYLNNDANSPVKGEVLSIATFYNESERIKWRSAEKESLDTFVSNSDTLMNRPGHAEFYLYKLNGSTSPYATSLHWYFPHLPSTGVTTDYFQYMIIGNQLPASDLFESGRE